MYPRPSITLCSSTVLRYRYLVQSRVSVCGICQTRTLHPQSPCLLPTSRRLSTEINKPPAKDEGEISGVLPHIEKWKTESRRKQDHSKDIVINDLQATLEAHRATNRASTIRKIRTGVHWKKTGFKSPTFKNAAISSVTPPHDHKVSKLETPQDVAWELEMVPEAEEPNKEDIKVVNTPGREYVGEYREPGKSWTLCDSGDEPGTSTTEIDRPWLRYLEDHTGDGLQRLHNEIKGFENYMKLTHVEDAAAQNLTQELIAVASAILPSNPVSIHGSRATGLAGPLSDIDFSLSLPEFEKDPSVRGPSATRPESRRAGLRVLRTLCDTLKENKQFTNVELIKARVPIVSGVDRSTRLTFQFQTLSPINPALEYTAYYLSEIPSLRPLFIVLRSCLHMRGLTESLKGGVSAYPLFMMIVAALKHAPGAFAHDDLAGQLLHVLKFYANADLYKNAYSADPPRTFPKIRTSMSAEEREARSRDKYLRVIDLLPQSNPKQPWLLSLQDPANPVNDLGRKAHQIKHVQALFKVASERILDKMQQWDRLSFLESRHVKRSKLSLLDPLVRASYDRFEAQRRKLKPPVRSRPSIAPTQEEAEQI